MKKPNAEGQKIGFIEREAILLTPQIKAKVVAQVKATLAKARQIWKVKVDMPEIRYDLKSTAAGMASPEENRLRFHAIFLAENETEYITETVPREVAHLLVPVVGPILRATNSKMGDGKFAPNGREWKAIVTALGKGPKPGQTWQDIIRHRYDPTSLELPPKKPTGPKGPRKPGGRKVGEIILKINQLKPDEMDAFKKRVGFKVKEDKLVPPSPKELQEEQEKVELAGLLKKYQKLGGDAVSIAGWAKNVILHLTTEKIKQKNEGVSK